MICTIRRTLLTAGAAALVLGLAACGDDGDLASPSTPQPSESESEQMLAPLAAQGTGAPFEDLRVAASHMPMTAAALADGIAEGAGIEGDTASGAAELRAGLTGLLTEHVYLAGVAVATAYATAPDSAEFQAAADALDVNSVAIADAIGSVVPDRRDEFLDGWRAHIGDFVGYAVAARDDDEAAKDQEVADLMAYTTAQGAFFEEITGGALPAAAVTESLNEHVTTLAAAVDGLAAGDTAAYDLLKTAGDHMAMSAEALAGGIAAATEMDGDPADDASALRAGLTSQLTSHVYLAGISVFAAYTVSPDSPEFEAAAAALDENSTDLAAAVGSVAPDQQDAFLKLWRAHITDFVEYAVAAAGGDDAGQQQQLDDLNAYRGAAGEFFDTLTGGALPSDDVVEALGHHVETLAGAIDSFAGALAGQ
ncbi:MAG: hypothetical protein ACRDWI_01175 [Jiangellaceae bacterium]